MAKRRQKMMCDVVCPAYSTTGQEGSVPCVRWSQILHGEGPAGIPVLGKLALSVRNHVTRFCLHMGCPMSA